MWSPYHFLAHFILNKPKKFRATKPRLWGQSLGFFFTPHSRDAIGHEVETSYFIYPNPIVCRGESFIKGVYGIEKADPPVRWTNNRHAKIGRSVGWNMGLAINFRSSLSLPLTSISLREILIQNPTTKTCQQHRQRENHQKQIARHAAMGAKIRYTAKQLGKHNAPALNHI